jgi:acyl carrier protein
VSLESELKGIVINDLGMKHISLDEFADDTPLFVEGIGLDSLDAVELVVQIQKKFGIKVESIEENREAMATVATLASFIRGIQDAQ